MQPQRTAITDRLSDVINIIHMGEKSGVLTVERGENRTFEEGFIRFNSGRIVEANTNQLSGMPAFTYLNSWLACRFSFVVETPNDPPFQAQSTQPLPINRDLPHTNPTTPTPATNYYHSDPMIITNHDDKLYAYRAVQRSRPNIPLRLQAGEKAIQLPENTVSLSRLHRRLLMLVDGQRSVIELARLISRSNDETQLLLDDLERLNFIRQ